MTSLNMLQYALLLMFLVHYCTTDMPLLQMGLRTSALDVFRSYLYAWLAYHQKDASFHYPNSPHFMPSHDPTVNRLSPVGHSFHNGIPLRPVLQDGYNILGIANHPVWRWLDSYECGDSAADRIIGGVNAALGQFPWIARLGYLDEGELDYMCGGALITDKHVVTAAHCVQDPEEDGLTLTTIRLGEHNINTDPDCELSVCAPPVQDRKVKKIIRHPQFNHPSFHNDIAVVELETPVVLNAYVAPICLPKTFEQQADLRIGDLITVAGWGKMNMTTEDRAEILQVVSVPVVNQSACNSFAKGFTIMKSEICAGSVHNKDACGGDSGGPFMKVFDTPEGPKSYLVGVVSFGPTICGIKKPGVYTSVAYFLKWILDNIK